MHLALAYAGTAGLSLWRPHTATVRGIDGVARAGGLATMGMGACTFAAFSVAMDKFMGFH